MRSTTLIEGFVDREGTISGLVVRRRIRAAPPMIGNTVSSYTASLEEAKGATDALRRLLAEVGFRGAFNVEFKYDVRDALGQGRRVEEDREWSGHASARASDPVGHFLLRRRQVGEVDGRDPTVFARVHEDSLREVARECHRHAVPTMASRSRSARHPRTWCACVGSAQTLARSPGLRSANTRGTERPLTSSAAWTTSRTEAPRPVPRLRTID